MEPDFGDIFKNEELKQAGGHYSATHTDRHCRNTID